MLNIEGKVIVGNDDAKNIKRNHVIRQKYHVIEFW
jgi:hypothetical protein